MTNQLTSNEREERRVAAEQIATATFSHPAEWQHRQVLTEAIEATLLKFSNQTSQRWCGNCGSRDVVDADFTEARRDKAVALLRTWSEETDIGEIQDQERSWAQTERSLTSSIEGSSPIAAATAMRTACVEKVKKMRGQWHDQYVTAPSNSSPALVAKEMLFAKCRAASDIATALESLQEEQEKHGREDR